LQFQTQFFKLGISLFKVKLIFELQWLATAVLLLLLLLPVLLVLGRSALVVLLAIVLLKIKDNFLLKRQVCLNTHVCWRTTHSRTSSLVSTHLIVTMVSVDAVSVGVVSTLGLLAV
jgi:hypothetical protein